MEPRPEAPRREEPKTLKPHPREKAKRFRLIKLEHRIAPRRGTNDSLNHTGYSIE
jgi:hypothetical protein